MRTGRERRDGRRGQVIVMVTLALICMFGMLALAVDFGWAFFVKRAAQRAADTAALAAVNAALANMGQEARPVCGSEVACQSISSCPTGSGTPLSNLDVGCAYAAQNGFRPGGNSNRQVVTIEAQVPATGCTAASPPNCVPTAPGVAASYWVTVRVAESIPQLFAAVLGQTQAVASARATAAMVDAAAVGSLILLNRENDASGPLGRGGDLASQGGSTIDVPGGIVLASQCHGSNCSGIYAGKLQGSGTLTSPYTYIRGTGTACAGNLGCSSGSSWMQPPANMQPLGSRMFLDPMRGKGQPPLTDTGLADRSTGFVQAGGTIAGGTATNPTVLPSGNYYAWATDKRGERYATGDPITLGDGYFAFGSCGGSFGDYVFFGGLRTGSSHTVVTFAPGRYVFAGQSKGSGGPLFELSNGSTIQDCTAGSGKNSDAGELLIFTDTNYPGLDIQVAASPLIAAIRGNLTFGTSGIKTGNNDRSSVTLHGLNDQNTEVVNAKLDPFSPVVLWQDQRNSGVRYDEKGYIVTSCGSIDNPCTNSPANDPSRAMYLNANSNLNLYGAIYQPRGAWLEMQAGGSSSGALQIVTGGIKLQGTPPLTLRSPENPITLRMAALVE